ncbi:MAG: glycine cleavage system aminomethyltransferase GcvT [bacterium]
MDTKKTPLYDEHIKMHGKMSDFAGWIMPLWYTAGQSQEHQVTRKKCGLFDICHMGEFKITGSESQDFLSRLLTNNVDRVKDGQAVYSFMLNEQGGVIDDCILYKFDPENWMLVVNAGNIDDDFNWIRKNAPSGVKLENASNSTAKIDLQGPSAPKLMAKIAGKESINKLRFFRFRKGIKINGMEIVVSRTGYTGEIGFELYTEVENCITLWRLLLQEGEEFGILPCGLGARDTLRTEAGLPLHGHELRQDRVAVGHPWEFAIDFESNFIGKEALEEKKNAGIDYYVVPFIIEGRRKAMPGWEALREDKVIGTVLSGVISPSLNNTPIGFAGLKSPLQQDEEIEFRKPESEKKISGRIAEIPFVSLTSRKKLKNFLV